MNKTLENIRNLHYVLQVDDERDIGNSIIVTLADGWYFCDDPNCGVMGFDTATEAKSGTSRESVYYMTLKGEG